MSDFNPSPERISMERKPVAEEVILFTVKGRQESVTPAEALSIINQLSGVLMAYEHSGGYTEYERKYLKHI